MLGKSLDIMSQFLTGTLPPTTPLPKVVKSKEIEYCVQCAVHCQGEQQYTVHLASRKHRKRVAGLARREGNKREKSGEEDNDSY